MVIDDKPRPSSVGTKIPHKLGKNELYIPNGNVYTRSVEVDAFPPELPPALYGDYDAAKSRAINLRAVEGRKRGYRGGALINWVAKGQWLRSEVKRYLKMQKKTRA